MNDQQATDGVLGSARLNMVEVLTNGANPLFLGSFELRFRWSNGRGYALVLPELASRDQVALRLRELANRLLHDDGFDVENPGRWLNPGESIQAGDLFSAGVTRVANPDVTKMRLVSTASIGQKYYPASSFPIYRPQ